MTDPVRPSDSSSTQLNGCPARFFRLLLGNVVAGGKMRRLIRFATDNSLLLILGAVAGVLWANLWPASYLALKSFALPYAGEAGDAHARHVIDLEYLINDVLMAFFFALAGKEVWEAVLPGGSLRDGRSAAVPILCALGGMAGPVGVYLLLVLSTGQWDALCAGWAIPCATDIAFSYLVARLVFGRGHPAVPFLLLLAIADDALGLAILALFFPVHPVKLQWLLLVVAGIGAGLLLRRAGTKSFWWYLLGPGVLSWMGFSLAGLHPAMGLLPIVPTMPHMGKPEPHPHWEALHHPDTLDRFEAWWKRPVEVILGFFALLNAGVSLGEVSSVTWCVLAALLLGKPAGIFLTGLVATSMLGLRLSQGLRLRDLFVIGCAAGIGFTVALFVATVAFEEGAVQNAAKMGALGSCAAAGVTVLAAWMVGVERDHRRCKMENHRS